ncbi:MAG TPA: zf-HC2 domain-containing protein [Bacteroidales bacterium]|nr:zf-HC2 domain-containing protein [Bacteroidales bacterium]HPS15650.1 zf-HC2 domain-containing protein [Bacteroidales bacterium]
MNCKQIKNKLFFLAEGTLKNDEANDIRQHLSKCPSCMEQYKLLSGFENIITEEKNTSPGEYFYTRLSGRLENTSPLRTTLRPAMVFINTFIITIIIGIAIYSGITIAERNYQYLGSSQEQQTKSNDISNSQDLLTSNISEY